MARVQSGETGGSGGAGPIGQPNHIGLGQFGKVAFESIVQRLLDVHDELSPDDLQLGIGAPGLNPDAHQQGKSNQKSYPLELQLFHATKLGAYVKAKNWG